MFLAKFPLLSEPKKQYAVKSNGEVKKVPASTEAGEIKKTVLEAVVKDSQKSTEDVVSANEFAKVGVLDYYPGGYHVVYPDGFNIDYSPSLFEARSPAGGRVAVTIASGGFKVETDLSNTPADQQPIIEAAARLISNSFSFLSDQGYDSKSAKERFSN